MQAYWSLEQISKTVANLALRIHPPSHALPTYGRTEDGARPHVEVDDQGYHYIIVERGKEIQHQTTERLSELLYWIFSDVVFIMASDYELENRIPNQDFRRLLFAKEIELMGVIDPNFEVLHRKEIDAILQRNPYNDSI